MFAVGMLLAGCSSDSPSSSSALTTDAAINRLVAAGISQAQAKQFAQAQTTFHDVLSLDPGNQYAWYNLGVIAQAQNHAKTAVSDYQQAIMSNPRDTSAMYNEAIALEPTNKQQSLSLYKQIVAINPKAATAYLRMSFLYDEMGDNTDAVAARNKATTLDPALGSVTTPTT